MRAVGWSFALLIVAAASGCHAGRDSVITAPAPPASAAPAQSKPAASAPQASALPNDIRWVQRSAEYQAAVAQTYRAATTRVEREAGGRAPGSWAVVLDADETVLSNLQYQIERAGLGYSGDSWGAWVRRREATPLPGASSFLARVHALGGRIAIVTNRLEAECEDTVAVFRRQRLMFDAMLCRPDKGPSDKNPRFEAVAAGKTPAAAAPLEIVAFIGDNILDFPALSQAVRDKGEAAFTDFGVRYFLLPNPMYGSWERN
jgi:5'-nucleotidase (lipoprotein e(P4) family)